MPYMRGNLMVKEEMCDGCCYRRTCSKDLEKCCYLSSGRCIVNEYSDNYMFKERGKKQW